MIGEIVEFAGLLQHKTWSRDRLEELRRRKLRRIVQHAWEHVPYYRRLMERAGIQPGDIREVSDLRNFPISRKPDLREAGSDLVWNCPGAVIRLPSSGHSGQPFATEITAAEARTRRLREFRMLIGVGVRPRDRLVLLGPTHHGPRRLHQSLGLYRTEVISCSLPEEEQLRRFQASKPDVLWAYPTVLKTALTLAKKELPEIARPRFLVTSSQVMDSPFRQRLRLACPGMDIVDVYGSTEAGRIASSCRRRTGLHLEDDAVIFELVQDGQPCAAGEEGSAVITCLDQFRMPFIRFELGDLCTRKTDRCGCGWNTPRIEPPKGRCADMITLPDGRRISVARLDVSIRSFPTLAQFRFVQHNLEEIEGEFYFQAPPSEAALEELRRTLEQSLYGQLRIRIRLMPSLRVEGPKFKVFVSKLPSP